MIKASLLSRAGATVAAVVLLLAATRARARRESRATASRRPST